MDTSQIQGGTGSGQADYQTALGNLQSGGLKGTDLTNATASLNNAYGVNGANGLNAGVSAPPVSQTQDAHTINTQLSGQTSGTVFPTPPAAPTKSVSNNTSVPNPIPTPQDIISQGNAQTPGEQTNQNLLSKVAALIGQKKSQTGLTNTAEANAGVPALSKTVSDLNTQLEGLNNQALDLQNQARPGGAIENSEQQGVLGRGVTAAGLAPQTAGDLRKNQIQQSAIASQALTLKSAIYGAQGNLTLAKDAADKAAQAQFEDQQNQIDYQNALIQANLPQMTKEEKNQALLVQTKLTDRQTQINQSIDDKKTIVALAAAAMKNNPNNPDAQYAAQQALTESNKPQPNLTTAFGLIGKYQSDPLDTQLKIAQIQHERAATDQINNPGGTPKQQNALEQQYRTALLKEVSNRSGGIGLQTQKVDQATHLMALANSYKDAKGNYNIPTAQYAELALGLASMLSPTGQTSEGDRAKIQSMTAAGNIKGAIQYITGVPQTGNTQAVIKNLVDSVNRQGTVAEDIRTKDSGFLQGLAPTGLSQDRIDQLNKATLAPFDNGDPYRQYRSQLQPGEILVNRNGKATAIKPSELWATDTKL